MTLHTRAHTQTQDDALQAALWVWNSIDFPVNVLWMGGEKSRLRFILQEFAGKGLWTNK